MKFRRTGREGSQIASGFYRVAPIRGTVVTTMLRPTRRAIAMATLIAAGLALAGCGRKAGLDPPPTAAGQPEAQTVEPQSNSAEVQGRALFGSSDEETALPPARAGKKAFVLDPLLD